MKFFFSHTLHGTISQEDKSWDLGSRLMLYSAFESWPYICVAAASQSFHSRYQRLAYRLKFSFKQSLVDLDK